MRKLFVITMSLIIFGSLLFSSVLAHSIYEKYNDTLNWNNSSLLSKIHQVPPSLAKNYISTEEQELFEILIDVNIALNEIKANGEIDDRKHNDYWELYDKAKIAIENSNAESLPSEKIFEEFQFYLEVDLAIKKAYIELNVESLDEYAKALSKNLKSEDSKIDRSLLNSIRKIAESYKKLEEFSSSALSKLGVVEDNILYVDIKVNRNITDELIREIEEGRLDEFPHIRDLLEILKDDSWNKILAHNSSSLEYYSWKESEKILNALSRSNYISVSSFNTVEDVLKYDPSISLEERENHTINRDSVVTGVYYNGELLNENLYVKRGTPLTFTIDYEYTELPKSTIVVKYVDIDGNELASEESYTNYVGSPIQIDKKNIQDYVLVRVEHEISEFIEDDHVIIVVYEKVEPEIIEDEEDEEDDTEKLEDEEDEKIDEEETEEEIEES